MRECKNAAPTGDAVESGGRNSFQQKIPSPEADSITLQRQKQQRLEERLLFILVRAAKQNGGDLFIPYSVLSCISLIPEDELPDLCDFSTLFGVMDE